MPDSSVLLVHTDHHAWHLKAQREVHRHQENLLYACRFRCQRKECGHFLFGHVCRNQQTERMWAVYAPLRVICWCGMCSCVVVVCGGCCGVCCCMFDMWTLLRHITLRSGPVVVRVETIPLRQRLVFETRLQRPCSFPGTSGEQSCVSQRLIKKTPIRRNTQKRHFPNSDQNLEKKKLWKTKIWKSRRQLLKNPPNRRNTLYVVRMETDKTASDIQARSFVARTLGRNGKEC